LIRLISSIFENFPHIRFLLDTDTMPCEGGRRGERCDIQRGSERSDESSGAFRAGYGWGVWSHAPSRRGVRANSHSPRPRRWRSRRGWEGRMSVRGLSVGPLVLRASSGGSAGASSELSSRLVGVRAPVSRLPFAPGEPLPGSMVSLAELARRDSLAVFFYGGIASGGAARGRRGGVGIEAGARVEGWRECEAELEELGYRIVGVSSQSSEAQAELALDRMVSSFTFLSDSELLLADELGLPTGRGPAGERAYEPLTMLIRDGCILWVFYPLMSPAVDAEIAIKRIRKSRG
jgi:peroxiredoxin